MPRCEGSPAVAYEWIAPVATAATGIAGACFTWLTSRSAGKTQRAVLLESARWAAKRESFEALLDALQEFENKLVEIGPRPPNSYGEEELMTRYVELTEVLHRRFDQKVQSALLSGSESLRLTILASREDLLEICEMVREQSTWRFLKTDLRRALIGAMRKELGYSDDAVQALPPPQA